MNVIIQAGGKGTRLGRHTKNKPKCLVEFEGKTLLQRQIENYNNEKIFIIGDYKFKVLEDYVATFFSDYDIEIIKTTGATGTLSGLRQALQKIDNDDSILFMWSDLVLDGRLHHKNSDIQIFTTNNFLCRYRLDDDSKIIKETSANDGIMGAFTIRDKNVLSSVPMAGSFVSGWLKDNIDKLDVIRTNISFAREVGELKHLDREFKNTTSRFFNSIEFAEEEVTKKCLDPKYEHLIDDEKRWYKEVKKLNFKNIPDIISYNLFKMERIVGNHCHQKTDDWSLEQKIEILNKIGNALHSLHSLSTVEASRQDLVDVYKNKTFDRIKLVEKLIPFFESKDININGTNFKNPFHPSLRDEFLLKIEKLNTDTFNIIHGDPTFNNFLITKDEEVFFFDPRGSFSQTKVYGDKRYDWAKLYYSVVGNYDSVNEKRFKVDNYDSHSISYTLESNGWESLEQHLIKLSKIDRHQILLLNCLIWFSFCGYLRDYDSILVSYAKGVELWNQIC